MHTNLLYNKYILSYFVQPSRKWLSVVSDDLLQETSSV